MPRRPIVSSGEADRQGFEPWVGGSLLHSLSRRAPSTTRAPVRETSCRDSSPDRSLRRGVLYPLSYKTLEHPGSY